MIVATVTSPRLRASVRRAARPDEDVVVGPDVWEALERGFPRAVILEGRDPGAVDALDVPALSVDERRLRRWEEGRRRGGPDDPPGWIGYAASRIGIWLEGRNGRPTWVDRDLSDLARIAGQPLPPPLRGMARRVLEFPSRYVDLTTLASLGGLTAGALKARFRRRGLASPHVYMRWFRCLAVARILSDPSVTTTVAAHRVGLSSSGNLSRSVQDTTGLRPTALRTEGGRGRLVVGLVGELMDSAALRAWQDLAPIFLEVA